MSEQISSVLRIVEGLADAMQTMQGGQDKLIGVVGTLNVDVRQMAGTLDTLEADVRPIAGRLDTLEADVRPIAGRLDTLEADVRPIAGRLDTLEVEVRPIAGRLDTLEVEVRRLAEGQDKLRGNLMARMDRLQDGQAQMRDELAVNYAADEQIGRRLDNRDDVTRALREQVAVMVRMLRNMENRVRTLEEGRDQRPGRAM